MINEFDRALKPKAYTKIVQASMKSILLFDLKRIIFISFRQGFHQVLDCLSVPSHAIQPIQPIYQNVLEICLEVDNFYIGYWLTWPVQVSSLVSNLPRSCNFIQYNSFFQRLQKVFFELNTGFRAYP